MPHNRCVCICSFMLVLVVLPDESELFIYIWRGFLRFFYSCCVFYDSIILFRMFIYYFTSSFASSSPRSIPPFPPPLLTHRKSSATPPPGNSTENVVFHYIQCNGKELTSFLVGVVLNIRFHAANKIRTCSNKFMTLFAQIFKIS